MATKKGYETNTLIFVHGAWHGAWAWDQWTAYFEKRGYVCRSFDLTGHGANPQDASFRFRTIKDYVRDLEWATAGCDAPILIGHSMGGLIIQRYLAKHTAKAAVLVAAVPHNGVPLSVILRLNWKAPLKILQLMLYNKVAVDTPRLVRDFFYHESTPDDIVNATMKRLVPESPAALWRLSLTGKVRWPKAWLKKKIPMLVVCGDRDFFLTVRCQKKLAARYKADFELFPGEAHNLMCDTGRERIAAFIHDWIKKTVP